MIRCNCLLCGLTVLAALGFLSLSAAGAADKADEKPAAENQPKQSIYDFEVETIDGQKIKLDKYRGDVLIIVNVASECGFTDLNYTSLQSVYEKYKDRGLRILAFPANNFANQEPGTNEEIKTFCNDKYNVTFDLFAKVSVAGEDQCDLFKYLTGPVDGRKPKPVKWNFQKYLISRNGEVRGVAPSRWKADDPRIVENIERLLDEPRPDATTGTDNAEKN